MSITKSCHLTVLIFLPPLKMFIITTPVLLPLVISIYINYSRLNPALQELFFLYGRKYLEQCIPDVMKQLPKYRLKKKIIESLLRIFLKTGFLSWYRYVYKWNEKNLNFSFVNKKDLNFSCFYLSSSFLSLL